MPRPPREPTDPYKIFYIQEQWDERGDMVFSGWNHNPALAFATYNQQAIIDHANKHDLTIRWVHD